MAHLIIEYFAVIFYAILFLLLIKKMSFFSVENGHKKFIYLIFIVKILMGIVLSYIYMYHYPDRTKADIYKYFDDGRIMYEALFHNPIDYLKMLFGIANDTSYFDTYYSQMNNWYRTYESNIYNDSHTIIRFNAFVHIFSFGIYNVHTVFMCFVSLTGQMALYKFFKNNSSLNSHFIIIAVFLLPTVVFWSSGVLKEGLLFFGMGMLLHYLTSINKKQFLKNIFWIGFAILLLSYLKFYIFAMLMPLLIAFMISKKWQKSTYIITIYMVLLFISIFAAVHFQKIFPAYNLLEIMSIKQNDFYYLALEQESGSLLSIIELKPHFNSIIINGPQAFLNVLFYPHIFQSQSIFSYFSAFENLVIIIISIVAILFFKFPKRNLNVFLFCLFFTCATYILIGLITPVAGAIVRYKAPVLPFLFIFLFLSIDLERLKKILHYPNKKL